MEQLIYEAKPYLCFGGGFLSCLAVQNGFGHGVLLILSGTIIWNLRRNYRKGQES